MNPITQWIAIRVGYSKHIREMRKQYGYVLPVCRYEWSGP
jgi:hypothetical protein